MRENTSQTGWFMFAAFTVGIIALYVNAFAVPPIISSLVRDRHISHADAGVLMTAFVFVYCFGSVAAGFLADRFGTRLVIGSGLLLASIASFLFTLTDSYPAMVATRALLGWGAASMFSPGIRFSISWLSTARANTIIGVMSAGIGFAITLAFLITPPLEASFGWESPLRIYAVVGFVVALAFVAFCRDNERASGLDSPTSPAPGDNQAGELDVFRNPVVLYASAGLFLVFIQLYGILTWIPPYLSEVLRMSAVEVGVTSMMLALMGIPACLLAGWIADKTGRMTLVVVVGLALSATTLFVIWMGRFTFLVVAALCAVIALGANAALVPLMAIPAKVVPPRAIGRATGFSSMSAYAGSIVGTYVGGFIVTWTGSYDLVFVIYTAVVVVAAVVVCPLMERALRKRLASRADLCTS